MKRTLILSIATLALSALAAPGFAQTYEPGHPRVNEVTSRQESQQKRIAEGVRSGELTRGEAARLEAQQQHIESQKERYMAEHNGHLTRREQIQLNREQNRASRNIYAKKHNSRVR